MLRPSLLLLSTSILCISCTGSQTYVDDTPLSSVTKPIQSSAKDILPVEKAPIWATTATPNALDIVRLTPGESKTVSLKGSISVEPFVLSAVPTSSVASFDKLSDRQVVVTATSAGTDLVEISDKTTGRSVFLPIMVEDLPIQEFTYDPLGRNVQRVALAGAFNGWSDSRDIFTKDDDGIFRLSKAIAPGTYTYKLVVDGSWVPDPANPKTDGSGYNNSILEIEGKKSETFQWQAMTTAMPGANQWGGFVAQLTDDETLQSTKLLINNQLIDPANYTLDGATLTIDRPTNWHRENFITLIGTTTLGRTGAGTFPVDFEGGSRSPRDEVIYYAFTDRFRDGDPSLNNPPEDERLLYSATYQGGDFAGITEKIRDGYFSDLGVTTLWLAPVNKNTPKVEQESIDPGRYFTGYHGYWPISFTETNEQFGTMDDLKTLVSSAHDNDIAILLDFVANHVHEDHPLIQENPDLAVPLKLPDGSNNIRQFDAHPLTTWFDTFLPTLNYEDNEEIVELMTDNAVWWLETTGADGFRHDAVKHIPQRFWETLTDKLDKQFHQDRGQYVYQVGETISGHDTVVKYVSPELLPGQFDFPTYFAIQGTLARGTSSMEDLGRAIKDAQRYYPASAIMSPLIGNHDVARFMGYADSDLPPGVDEKEVGYTNPPQVDDPLSYEKLKLGFAYLAALPGPPTIYYGDEIGLTGAHDPDNRRMMPWYWDNDQAQTHADVRALLKARHDSFALRRGSIDVLFNDSERLLISRTTPEEMVIIHLARNPETNGLVMTLPNHWGTPSGLENLVSKRATATLDGNRLSISDNAYGYGIWRVKW